MSVKNKVTFMAVFKVQWLNHVYVTSRPPVITFHNIRSKTTFPGKLWCKENLRLLGSIKIWFNTLGRMLNVFPTLPVKKWAIVAWLSKCWWQKNWTKINTDVKCVTRHFSSRKKSTPISPSMSTIPHTASRCRETGRRKQLRAVVSLTLLRPITIRSGGRGSR